MFSTITGIKFKSKNVEDLLEEVHKKLGVDKETIYIHNNYVGFFKDNEIIEEDKEVELLDYKRGKIIKKIPPPGFNIYKHLLCEEEEELPLEKEEEVDFKKLVATLENPSESDKQMICDNMEDVIKEIFKDRMRGD